MKTITTNRTPRAMLRPLAALLMMGMGGSVFAETQELEQECAFEALDETSRRRCENVLKNDAGFDAPSSRRFVPQTTEVSGLIAFEASAGSLDAVANSDGSMAIGRGSIAGDDTDSTLGQATAIGHSAIATAWSATAIGAGAKADAVGAIAIGYEATVNLADDDAYYSASHGIAIGSNAKVAGIKSGDVATRAENGVAIGLDAWAAGDNSVAIGANSQADDAMTFAVGGKGYQRRIVNVAQGIDHDDATTVGQLLGAAQGLGGGAIIDGNGQFVAPSYVVQGITHQNVGDALAALDGGLDATNQRVEDLAAAAGGGSHDLIAEDAVTGDLSVGGNAGGHLVDFAGIDGARVLSGVADGALVVGSLEAVNGGQLAEIRDQLSGRVAALDGHVAALGDRVDTLEGGSVTPPPPPVDGGEGSEGNIGNDAGGNPVTNVGDGIVDSDAANMGQVHEQVEQAVATAKSYTDQRVDTLGKDVEALGKNLESFKGEVGDRFRQQDARIDKVGAMSAANAQMAINAAGVGVGKGRMAVGVGMQSNQRALAVGYAKAINEKVRVSFGGSFSGTQNSMGAGIGIDL